MQYKEYIQPESYEPWQPPKSLQIIPYQRIETCPISYTPESVRKGVLKRSNKVIRHYVHKLRIIEQYRDNTHSRPMLKKSGREDVVACFIIKRK